MDICNDGSMKQLDDFQSSSSPPAAMAQPTSRRPSLLPAFEPISSSPTSRPAKRKHNQSFPNAEKDSTTKHYPTPVPTSSTGILPSSPPQRQHQFYQNRQQQDQLLQQSQSQSKARPGLQRTISTLSERAPLSAVPSLTVSADGEPLLLGRSSSSSDYQLSANRLISRVHVKALYSPPSDDHPKGCMQIECIGWNGAKVHCHGQAQDLAKGDTLSFDDPTAEIMIDVQETRVILAWPVVNGHGHGRKGSRSLGSSHAWLAEVAASPSRRILGAHQDVFASSPPLVGRPHSPESPTPANRHSNVLSSALSPLKSDSAEHPVVQVYEDSASDDDKRQTQEDIQMTNQHEGPETRFLNETHVSDKQNRAASGLKDVAATSSPLSAAAGRGSGIVTAPGLLTSDTSDDFSDRDEENDPIIHSFGPYGANILPRLESFNTNSPVQQHQSTLRRRLHSLKQKPVAASSPIPQQKLAADSFRGGDADGTTSKTGLFSGVSTSFSSPAKGSTTMTTRKSSLDRQEPAAAAAAAATALSDSPIRNHVINQLAFSRLHAMPLSTVWGNLPLELKLRPAQLPSRQENEPTGLGIGIERGDAEGVGNDDSRTSDTALGPAVGSDNEHRDQPSESRPTKTASSAFTPPALQHLLETIPCVGLIEREGKDAAGKPLEAQFYYVPEMDENIVRREAVIGGRGGTGLRAVRRSHKQYYWKRPRH